MGRLRKKKNLVKAKRRKNEKPLVSSEEDLLEKVDHSLMIGEKKDEERKKEKKNLFFKFKSFFFGERKNFIISFFLFLKESKAELKKVVWPNKQQVMGSTFVVIIIVSLVSLFLGAVDAILFILIKCFLE